MTRDVDTAWQAYWRATGARTPGLFARLADVFRLHVIARAGAAALRRHFPDEPGRRYLHAGCGSGGSDSRLPHRRASFHALDLAEEALRLNRKRGLALPQAFVRGTLFALPYRDATFDGVFNFGVMEHFTDAELAVVFGEFRRVLRPDGVAVLFWPPVFGSTVLAFGLVLGVLNAFRRVRLHVFPPEVSRIRSFRRARALLARHGFRAIEVRMGPRDLFTQVCIVCRPA